MPSISVSESISQIQKKMDEFKRELTLLEGSLSVYNSMLARGVKTINVPEIIEIKCECKL
jgi:hypothetical protein